MAAEDLSDTPAQPIARDGLARATRDRDAESRAPFATARLEEEPEKASGHADSGGVALFEFPSLSKAVVAGEPFPDDPARVHTVSLLRPLRRRAEITARPERVRIRTRNPCVRLRRRLLG